MYRVWYSTKAFADYIVDFTDLKTREVTKVQMYESDASKPTNFHTLPDHIKKILYLDAPDLIVEYNSEPIFSIEISKEAGTGHNVFQRFARLGAAVENDVPAFFIYPDASIITRKKGPAKWDKLNGLIFKGLEQAMDIYQIPALFFYFSTDFAAFPDATKSPNLAKKGLIFDSFKYGDCPLHTAPDIQKLFECLNKVIEVIEKHGVIAGRPKLLREKCILDRRKFMSDEAVRMGVTGKESPVSATQLVPTEYLINYLSKYNTKTYTIGELLRGRENTLIYCVDASFRGDPYPGSLAGLDYLICRQGKSFEERYCNLVLCWGKLTVDHANKTLSIDSTKCVVQDFVKEVKNCLPKSLLGKCYNELKPHEIPRYYMQVRYGSSYSKVKHIRVYSYFADAILFTNGALWRDA